MSGTTDVDELSLSEEKDEKNHKKAKKGWSRLHITVEPIKFALGFTTAFTSGVIIDLVQKNVCLRQYGLSIEECTSLNVSKEIKTKAEGETAQINMIMNLIQGVAPLLLIVFIGPWSDKYGRKPFLLLAVKGFTLYYLMWAVISIFPSIPVVYLYIPSVVLSCTGTIVVVMICTWSYTCDNFGVEDLTVRFSVISAADNIGSLAGNGLAEKMLIFGGEYGFQLIFGISFIMSLASLFYTTYVLEETIIIKKGEKGKLFNLVHLKSLYKAIFYPLKGRLYLTLTLAVIITEIPLYAGEDSIYYLAGKSLFNWSLGRYNLFVVLQSLCQGIVSTFIVWCLMEQLGVSNSVVLVLSSTSLAVLHFFRVYSVSEDMFWTFSLLIKSVNLIGSAIDAELTSCISEENVGKAFTLTSLIDCLTPLVSAPLYAQVYTEMLPDNTIYLFMLSFILALISMLSSIWLYFYKKRIQYMPSQTEASSDDQNKPNESSSVHSL